MRHELDPDIMLFGPSTVIKHYSPNIIRRNTGFSVYNMGYDGMFSLQSSGLIHEFLSYTKNCKYIVIGGIHFLDRDWVIARTDLFYAYLNNENIYQSLTCRIVLDEYQLFQLHNHLIKLLYIYIFYLFPIYYV
jgi:hypothetical protein